MQLRVTQYALNTRKNIWTMVRKKQLNSSEMRVWRPFYFCSEENFWQHFGCSIVRPLAVKGYYIVILARNEKLSVSGLPPDPEPVRGTIERPYFRVAKGSTVAGFTGAVDGAASSGGDVWSFVSSTASPQTLLPGVSIFLANFGVFAPSQMNGETTLPSASRTPSFGHVLLFGSPNFNVPGTPTQFHRFNNT